MCLRCAAATLLAPSSAVHKFSPAMTSSTPLSAPEPQLLQQLDALLQHDYSTPASDSTPPPTSTPSSTDNADASLDPQADASAASATFTDSHNSRTAPAASLPATSHLQPILAAIAATGRLSGYPWPAVRELLILRARVVLDEYVQHTGGPPTSPSDPSESYEPRVAHLLLLIALFASPPFTLQRLCELLCEPRQHYHSTSHYLAALCKCVYGITADEEEEEWEAGGLEGDEAQDDEAMALNELEAAGVHVTSAMDYLNKEAPIATVMPSVLSVEQADEHSNNMETSE